MNTLLPPKPLAQQHLTPPVLQAPEESKKKLFALIALVVAATVCAYLPVLFNFFNGDDFVHLTWLRHAVHQPELIWKNFYSSWLDGTTTKFYRPLISVFMVTDYLGWGTNGLGFHITNLLFHLSSTVLLYGIVRQVQKQMTGAYNNAVAVTAAAVFGLYPLHPEAVSWITGRVDSVVTAFITASIYSYLKFRADESSKRWLVVSLSTLILGLLSKEMAITVPAVIFAFEFFAPNPKLSRFVKTLPFWVVLAGYFGVRRLALGTFVGGYDDSLLFIANLKEFALNWLHAVRMLLIPINKEVLGSHHLLTKTWEVLVAASVMLLALRFVRNAESRRPVLFAGAWLVLSLAPVYKLFAIADDLQGSRLAYLATVPLAVLFAYGLCAVRRGYLAAFFCGVSLVLLWMNNEPWRVAGQQMNAIRASLESIYDKQHGADPQTLLIGVPDHYKGAYVARNSIWGMTKYPQQKWDIWNCLTLNEFEPVHPFGFLKDSLAAHKDEVKVYRWDATTQQFKSVAIQHDANAASENVAARMSDEPPVAARMSDEALRVANPAGPHTRPEYVFTPPTNCWDTDFVRVNLDVTTPATAPQTGADLLYADDISPEFQLGKRTHADWQADAKHQTLVFALRSLPEWSFGNSQARLKLMLPPGCTVQIKSVEVVPAAKLIPQINFDNAGYMGTKGYMHLGKDAAERKLSIDATGIEGATSTEVEITRPNLLFEQQNADKFSSFAREHTAAPLKGTFTLHKADYMTPGIYELRVWAKDASGKVIGRSSDHIVLSVDP